MECAAVVTASNLWVVAAAGPGRLRSMPLAVITGGRPVLSCGWLVTVTAGRAGVARADR